MFNHLVCRNDYRSTKHWLLLFIKIDRQHSHVMFSDYGCLAVAYVFVWITLHLFLPFFLIWKMLETHIIDFNLAAAVVYNFRLYLTDLLYFTFTNYF